MEIKQFDSKYEACWSDADAQLLCLDTGVWRTTRPVLDKDKCNYCALCSLFCPLQCMIDNNDYFEPDLAFCKGCGICAHECTRKALSMVPEQEF